MRAMPASDVVRLLRLTLATAFFLLRAQTAPEIPLPVPFLFTPTSAAIALLIRSSSDVRRLYSC